MTGYSMPSFGLACVIAAMNFLIVSPWLFTRPAWAWWPCYLVFIWITYRIGENVTVAWDNYFCGRCAPFSAWSSEIKFMMIYATIELLFLVAQIIVLPLYRHFSTPPTRTPGLVMA